MYVANYSIQRAYLLVLDEFFVGTDDINCPFKTSAGNITQPVAGKEILSSIQ
jgi:hypothetical protein